MSLRLKGVDGLTIADINAEVTQRSALCCVPVGGLTRVCIV